MQFRSNQIVLQRTPSQMRDAALAQAGQSPQLLALKPGTHRHRDRRQDARNGRTKHKSKVYDF